MPQIISIYFSVDGHIMVENGVEKTIIFFGENFILLISFIQIIFNKLLFLINKNCGIKEKNKI